MVYFKDIKMKQEHGLTRIPFYSELTVFNRESVANDAVALVLSVMLYWHSLEKYMRFNARNHLFLLARNLRLSTDTVKECLDYLCSLKRYLIKFVYVKFLGCYICFHTFQNEIC